MYNSNLMKLKSTFGVQIKCFTRTDGKDGSEIGNEEKNQSAVCTSITDCEEETDITASG
jgi:hypothetical protein